MGINEPKIVEIRR